MNPPSEVTLLGIVHPADGTNEPRGPGLSKRDIQKITRPAKQKEYPMMLEHRRELGVIGKVIRTHLAPGDKLGVVGLINVNSPGGALFYRWLKAGKVYYFSVRIEPNKSGSLDDEDMMITEVTVTEFPRLSQTQVQFVSEMHIEDRETALQRSWDKLFEKLYKRMVLYFPFNIFFHYPSPRHLLTFGTGSMDGATKKEVVADATPTPPEKTKEPEETKPFPPLDEGLPADWSPLLKAEFTEFRMNKRKKAEDSAAKVRELERLVAKRRGVEAYSAGGLGDLVEEDEGKAYLRDTLLEVAEAVRMFTAEEERQKYTKSNTPSDPDHIRVQDTIPPPQQQQQMKSAELSQEDYLKSARKKALYRKYASKQE